MACTARISVLMFLPISNGLQFSGGGASTMGFVLHDSSGMVHCSGETPLFKGASQGRDDCMAKCAQRRQCQYASFWSSNAKWCHLTKGCADQKVASDHLLNGTEIEIYHKEPAAVAEVAPTWVVQNVPAAARLNEIARVEVVNAEVAEAKAAEAQVAKVEAIKATQQGALQKEPAGVVEAAEETVKETPRVVAVKAPGATHADHITPVVVANVEVAKAKAGRGQFVKAKATGATLQGAVQKEPAAPAKAAKRTAKPTHTKVAPKAAHVNETAQAKATKRMAKPAPKAEEAAEAQVEKEEQMLDTLEGLFETKRSEEGPAVEESKERARRRSAGEEEGAQRRERRREAQEKKKEERRRKEEERLRKSDINYRWAERIREHEAEMEKKQQKEQQRRERKELEEKYRAEADRVVKETALMAESERRVKLEPSYIAQQALVEEQRQESDEKRRAAEQEQRRKEAQIKKYQAAFEAVAMREAELKTQDVGGRKARDAPRSKAEQWGAEAGEKMRRMTENVYRSAKNMVLGKKEEQPRKSTDVVLEEAKGVEATKTRYDAAVKKLESITSR